jgi:peptidoglycan/xylan/chitin deacetylase (PgdA/CDA1 family)
VLNFNFHGIGSPKARDFGEGEHEFWATPALFEATLDAAGGREDVTLSFDDGNSTDVDIALPALRERGLLATFFIVPCWLGTHGFLTEADVRTLAASGMTVGNHGLAHRFWTQLSATDLEHELTEGRRRLEQLTGTRITTLAIPYGAYDDAVLETLRRHDYAHVFTSDGGTAKREVWLQPREHLRADQTRVDLERMLTSP